jgi:hypothetical protein
MNCPASFMAAANFTNHTHMDRQSNNVRLVMFHKMRQNGAREREPRKENKLKVNKELEKIKQEK